MSDIEGLKQRIEQAELRLKTAHSARQRESAALTAMWNQIRDRFAAQSTEIVHLRGRVATLEDTRDQLQGMVRSLLGAVEGSIDRMTDEAVPRIAGLAEELLDAELPAASMPPDTAPMPCSDEPGSLFGRDASAESSREEDDADFMAILSEHLSDDEKTPSQPAPPSGDGGDEEPGEAVSPGIRSLIARIEESFDGKNAHQPVQSEVAGAKDDEDVELARDLDDIKRLRDELQSLRTRIGVGGR